MLFFNSNSKWLDALNARKKTFEQHLTYTFLRRVNFILMFFQELPSFLSAGTPFPGDLSSIRLKSQRKVMPQGDTDFSKLVNICPVKKVSLISTHVYLF